LKFQINKLIICRLKSSRFSLLLSPGRGSRLFASVLARLSGNTWESSQIVWLLAQEPRFGLWAAFLSVWRSFSGISATVCGTCSWDGTFFGFREGNCHVLRSSWFSSPGWPKEHFSPQLTKVQTSRVQITNNSSNTTKSGPVLISTADAWTVCTSLIPLSRFSSAQSGFLSLINGAWSCEFFVLTWTWCNFHPRLFALFHRRAVSTSEISSLPLTDFAC